MNNSDLIKQVLKSIQSDIEKEKQRIFDKLMKDYGDKFHTEGMSDYQRRMEELDEIFDERMSNNPEEEK